MILVDTSVWIDYFNDRPSSQARQLEAFLGRRPIAIGDLMLTEILQGIRRDTDYAKMLTRFEHVPTFDLLGRKNAIKSAENYRALRKSGITVRKTVDCIIATYCIENDHELLFADRDFQPFVDHLGLRSAS